jgi:GNAT superfamily N-acetyltransferase
MGDLLVKLYDLPVPAPSLAEETGIRICRPLPPDKSRLRRWVSEHFSESWADELEMTFAGLPVSCFVAMDEESTPVGFACYDATFRGFFGPTGVIGSHRGRGIGTALLFQTLHAMSEAGYAYAIIGYSGADAFYEKTVGAIPIPGSSPGAYRDLLRRS